MNDYKSTLLKEPSSRSTTIGSVGLDCVGLALALAFEKGGVPVLRFDVDAKKPEALQRGEDYVKHIGPERVAAAFARGCFAATTGFARLDECDLIPVCVPTALGRHRKPDIAYIQKTAELVVDRPNVVPPTIRSCVKS